MGFSLFRKLHDAGVLGINRRNAHYIFGYNPRRLYPLVDDKLRTKTLAAAHGIRTPPLFGTVKAHGEVRRLGALLERHPSFVIKPVKGAMGNGVLVVADRNEQGYLKPSGALLRLKDVEYHVSGILSGLYSLGGRVDSAMIEHRVLVHPVFDRIAYGGVPDCRIIVFRGVPVMSMLRLPTRMSDGRANLHQGAIAAGVDISQGQTHQAVHLNRVIQRHPDTDEPVQGIQVPHWDEILHIATASADMTGLGYIGVDVVIDAEQGPMLLELNARPGLSIQIANGAGLIPLLDRIERLDLTGKDPWERITLAKALFADHLGSAAAAGAGPGGPAGPDAVSSSTHAA